MQEPNVSLEKNNWIFLVRAGKVALDIVQLLGYPIITVRKRIIAAIALGGHWCCGS